VACARDRGIVRLVGATVGARAVKITVETSNLNEGNIQPRSIGAIFVFASLT